MFRINIQDNLVVSIESMHHIADLTKIEGVVIDDVIIQSNWLPANYEQDVQGYITRIYNYLIVTTDKPSIIADGLDTVTITAQVDDPSSYEIINFYINGVLVDSPNAVNGIASIQVNATQTGEIVVEAESTTKYGRNSITIQAVSV